MSDNVVELKAKAAPPLAEVKAVGPSLESMNIGKSTTALIEAVVQTNLQAMQELLRADGPADLLKLQQRFARDYMTALMRGTVAMVDAVEAAGRRFGGVSVHPTPEGETGQSERLDALSGRHLPRPHDRHPRRIEVACEC